jgi:hypothetical protein
MCSICDRFGNIVAWSRKHDTGFTGFAFKCSCPKGKNNVNCFPEWSNFYNKEYSLDENYWDNVRAKKREDLEFERIAELSRNKEFESQEFKDYLLKYGREKVEEIYRKSKSQTHANP